MTRLPETVLVIGGRGGIGAELSRQLHDDGHRVIVTTRQPRPTGSTIEQVALDLESPTLRRELAELMTRYPDITTVMHCAGQNALAASGELDDPTLARMLTVNLRSAMTVGAVIGDHFSQQGGGTLLFVGSMLGEIGVPGYSAYCATKFGLHGYTEALRRELHHHGVAVLLVAPRATRTNMNSAQASALNEQLGNHEDDPAGVAARILNAWAQSRPRTPMGWPERFFAWLNHNLPFLVDKALSKQAKTVETYLLSRGTH